MMLPICLVVITLPKSDKLPSPLQNFVSCYNILPIELFVII